MPVSKNSSRTSRSFTGLLLMKYSLSPERYSRRRMEISGRSSGRISFSLERTRADLGDGQGLSRLAPGEDDVLHLLRAQRLRGLLAEHPLHGVDDVALAAAVGAQQGRHAVGEVDAAPGRRSS